MTAQTTEKQGPLLRFLGGVERVGNKLPHPFWLFVILSVVLVLVSWLLAAFDVSVVSPADGKTLHVRSLVSNDGVHMMVSDLVDNYVNFPPLGLITVVMLGVAVADKSGLLPAMMRAALSRVPAKFVTFAVALTCMFAQIAGDAAFVVMIPLAMIAFRAVGRNPIIGAIIAYVAVGGTSSVGMLPSGSDAVMAGISTAAARAIDPNYQVGTLSNYFFSLASAIMLAVVITVVTELVVAKRVNAMDARSPEQIELEELPDMSVSDLERKGIRRAMLAAVIYLGLLVLAMVPSGSPLRGDGGAIIDSPLFDGIVVFLMLFFMIIGVTYGITVGTISKPKDFPDYMGQGLRDLIPALILFFAISQFLGYFKWSNLGQVISIAMAQFLKDLGATPVLVFLGTVLLICVMDLFITSGSAMWSLVAPILVPMLMLLHIHPETTQALFRMADAPLNSITPMSPYFGVALGFIRRTRPSAGIGTLMSLVLPLAVVNLVVWFLMFLGWYALGIPLGPGAPVD
ncbi:AbgT family transporter [Sciscionella sediminilitoris]|uniref:AbgT family transporter n=1 Tax=Sciscionella sediminilitoris TaxID=1445613 RepID=UPI0004DF2721|nr:AbgT family transporter [Sciscionella sp. SE31]